MRKPLIYYTWIPLLLFVAILANPLRRPSSGQKVTPHMVEAYSAYKNLENQLDAKDLQAVTIIGFLNGAQQVHQDMEKNLISNVKDLLLNTNVNDSSSVLPKIEFIEHQLTRDEMALKILAGAMDVAMKRKSLKDFRRENDKMRIEKRRASVRSSTKEKTENANKIGEPPAGDKDPEISTKIGILRRHILKQMDMMKSLLDNKIEETLDYLMTEADANSILVKAGQKVLKKRQLEQEQAAEVRQIKSILNELFETKDDFRENLIEEEDLIKQDKESNELTLDNTLPFDEPKSPGDLTQNEFTSNENKTVPLDGKPGKQKEENSEESEEFPPANADGGGGGGGLAGLIGSLSGGEGGSDIGALVGALTGVISQIFGPGGLDIETLIGSAASLISGLLSGEKNFGTVLGGYVGTAFDGISGGGGAVNNGQFFGNFLGTVVASLSADPEEDDAPIRPLIFIQNFLHSFMEAKNRREPDEDEELEDRHGNGNGNDNGTKKKKKEGNGDAGGGGGGKGGSDSGAFIKHFVSQLVSSAVSIILNASLGAVGGASNASSSLFATSSGQHSGHG